MISVAVGMFRLGTIGRGAPQVAPPVALPDVNSPLAHNTSSEIDPDAANLTSSEVADLKRPLT